MREMSGTARRRLLTQGYSPEIIANTSNIGLLARLTPLMCALLGAVGLMLQSWIYMIALAGLTAVGAMSIHSGYEYLLMLFGARNLPEHGFARRFGCGIGALMYLASATGFGLDAILLAYVPALLMAVMGLVAATTHVCFASIIYSKIREQT